MLQHYLKIISRNLWKNKSYAAINIGGLSIALASFIIILLYLNNQLSYDRWNNQLKRVYRISMKSETSMMGDRPPAPLADLVKQNDPDVIAFTKIQASGDYKALISTDQKKIYQKEITNVDSGFLQVFPYKLLLGNPRTALQVPGSAVLTEALSKKLFGNDNPIGKTFTLYNVVQCRVTGIMQEPATPSHVHSEAIIRDPWIDRGNFWENYSYSTYLLTRKELSSEMLSDKIRKTYFDNRIKKDKQTYAEYIRSGHAVEFTADPVPDIHNFPKHGNTSFTTTLTLFLLAILLLCSGAINFSNLSLAKSIKRAKEVGVRKVLGSTRKKIIFQFLLDIALQCLLALLLAVLWTILALPLFNRAFGLSLSFQEQGNILQLLIQIAVALLLIAAFSGLYPALFLSRFQASKVLKGDFSGTMKSRPFSNSLIVVQFVVSVFFIISAIVIALQMHYMRNKDLGFRPSQVIRIEASQKTREENFPRVRNILAGIYGVEYVSKSTAVPGSVYIDTSTRQFSFNGTNHPLCSERVSTDYFRTLDISLIQGRLFSDQHPEDNNNTAIINEAGRHQLGVANPVGSLIRFPFCDSIPYQIVGVVKDFNVQGFENTVQPTVYSISNAHCGYQSGGAILLKLNTNDIQRTISEINSSWKKIEPDFPIQYSFLDQDFERLLESYLLLQNIIFIFTVISILIAMLGLLALTSYMAERRTKEIGIRKVLGASVLNLADLLTRGFIRLLLIAILIASPLAWYILNRWLQNFAYRITISWWVFAGAAAIATGLALVLVVFHAIRTARSNPVRALRNE